MIRRRGAFTLVELMVVVTMIGVLMGLATVGLRGVSEEGRLRAAADQLAAQLRAAQVHALTSRRPVLLKCTTDGCRSSKLIRSEDGWRWHEGSVTTLGVVLEEVQVGGGPMRASNEGQWMIPIRPDDWSNVCAFQLALRGGRRVVAEVSSFGGRACLRWIE